uniref:interleukin-31 receptor subunit alpha n=1 Tax=Semicossyphus pulcher TaxID=241346 RepID=UPI0037E881DB
MLYAESEKRLKQMSCGLILAYCTTLSSPVQASPVNCKSNNISSKYQNCGIQQDGVHDLDCFGKHHSLSFKTCMWKPGNRSSENTYTLILQQTKSYCKAHENITEFSKTISLFAKRNMTVEVLENSESANCTKAVFRGSPWSILRCAPPYDASFSRHSGRLHVNVSWQQKDRTVIKYYSVRYKTLSSLLWDKSLVQCQNGARCTVENLNSSLVYNVQIQCVTNKKCSQCVWSEVYTVPQELTSQPVIVNLNDTDIAERKGQRLIFLTWKFPSKELCDGYRVMIGKASGDKLRERIDTSQPEIRLILSYSAYHLNISAFNNASTSPAVSQIIPKPVDESRMGDGRLNVTAHRNTSFTVYWDDNLIKKYVCYSVEWMKKGHKAVEKSFYQNENNYRTLSSLPESLEPYKRYSLTLNTRPNKDTCNMKHINNSESIYGSTQFYFMEGFPVSAPTNISCYNVTLSSVVLQWLPIPEEDMRGFLLGYIIYYTKYHHTGTSTERNITVDPMFNKYELEDLESGTAYKVQISGFTKAGAGVRSTEGLFKTNYQVYSNHSSIIMVFAIVATMLIFGSPVIKRAKVILWPSIPSPRKSNAMQKIEGPREMELLESISPLKVEEWDTNSLQIVEKEEVIPTLPSTSLLQDDLEDDEDPTEITCDWFQSDTEDATEDLLPDRTAETAPDIQPADLQNTPFAFSTGYTTIEMFQQVMPQGLQVNTSTQATESEPEITDLTLLKSRFDHVGQFSTSPNLDDEDMSMTL